MNTINPKFNKLTGQYVSNSDHSLLLKQFGIPKSKALSLLTEYMHIPAKHLGICDNYFILHYTPAIFAHKCSEGVIFDEQSQKQYNVIYQDCTRYQVLHASANECIRLSFRSPAKAFGLHNYVIVRIASPAQIYQHNVGGI